MTGCVRLSDRIPDLALGRARWTAVEEAHLAACPDCRAEWELVRAAGRLGAGAPEMPDDAAVAAAVLRRLAEAPVRRPRGRALRWAAGLAAAAAIVAALWTGGWGTGDAPTPVAGGGGAEPVARLSTAQMDSLLDEEDLPLAGWSMLETPTLGDLNEDELERVLRTWEG